MSIIVKEQIRNRIKAELSNCNDSFTLISAYCKLSAVRFIDSIVFDRPLKKRIIVRMRPIDLIKRSTDLELYPYCANNGWELYFKTDLHAKLYFFDNTRFIIGSSNATSSGLILNDKGNFEMAVIGKAKSDDCQLVLDLIQESTRMTDAIYAVMKKYIEPLMIETRQEEYEEWPYDVTQLFSPDLSSLNIEDFPPCENPFHESSAAEFLDISPNADIAEITSAFSTKKCYQWLIKLLADDEDHKMQFWEVKNAINSALIGEHSIRDARDCLSRLQQWIEALELSEVGVDLPGRHSHRFFLRTGILKAKSDSSY